jgi:hypothetical protein
MKKSLLKVFILVCLLVSVTAMASAVDVQGTWTVYFDWFQCGYYFHSDLIFTQNGTDPNSGTFTDGGYYTGTWLRVDDRIVFQFDIYHSTEYSGTITGWSMQGMMRRETTNDPAGWFFAKKRYGGTAPESIDIAGSPMTPTK